MTYSIHLPETGTCAAWRAAARMAISHGLKPEELDWDGGGGLFAGAPLPAEPGGGEVRVPQMFLQLAQQVVWHSAPERFAHLYEALWRLHLRAGEPLSQADGLGRRLHLMAKAVGRDIHKMHAFVRFREVEAAGPRRSFAAWFEPEHHTLEPGSSFFAKRFADMDWLIVTPRLSARFADGILSLEGGGSRPSLPEDGAEELWQTYFANIFNPARIKLDAMRSEMPKKYWKNLPETRLIPDMLQDAEARVARMRAAGASVPRAGAAPVSTRYRAAMPQAAGMPQTLEDARAGALQCRRCGLCEAATQTVWGEGADDAHLMIVGEQPGDREDLTGRPFVGPDGQLLRGALTQGGLAEERLWLTHAVKHFKFKPQGQKRAQETPNHSEIEQCRWWLGLELAFIQPRITLALGASAALALTGREGRMDARRGTTETGLHGGPVLISWHPSHILRVQDATQQAQARHELAADLNLARKMAGF